MNAYREISPFRWEKLARRASKIASFRIRTVNLAECGSIRTATLRISQALDYGPGFGCNLDALWEVLLDRPEGIDLIGVFGMSVSPSSYQRDLLQLFKELGDGENEGQGRSVIRVITNS